MQIVLKLSKRGKPATSCITSDNIIEIKKLQLLTSKPSFFVCNVKDEHVMSGNEYTKLVQEFAQKHHKEAIIISAKIESEIACIESENEKMSS